MQITALPCSRRIHWIVSRELATRSASLRSHDASPLHQTQRTRSSTCCEAAPHHKSARGGTSSVSASPAAAEQQSAAEEVPEGESDARFMRTALDLARRGVGHTAPNPAVGCVIVANGEVIGEGFHPKAGQPHAEVFALRAAGQKARGATAYVTLEPCNHYGRTPPCARALVASGVARVVVGVTDPNPLVGGAGIKTLQDAGISVTSGVEEAACYEINEDFMQRMVAEAEAAQRGLQ